MEKRLSLERSGIVDRDDEINSLINSINTTSGLVNIIYSKPGVGKSSLVKKLTYKLNEQNIPNIILVKTLPLNTSTQSNEWLYIDLIFDAFNKHFEKSVSYSFSYFLSSGKSAIINKQMYERNLGYVYNFSSIKQFLFGAGISQTTQLRNLFEANPYRISTDNSMFARIIKAQYVEYVLNHQRILLVIDNIHNIDSTSLKFLLDWLNETKYRNHYFLFQYTITESSDITYLAKLRDLFLETGVSVKCTELMNMSSNFVADIIDNQIEDKPSSIRFNLDALQHYENCSNGNLRELLDYVRQYNKVNGNTEKSKQISSTAQLLLSLTPEAKSILAFLIFSSGEIPQTTLLELWSEYFEGGNILPILQELKFANIIEEVNCPVVSVSHSSIIDEWNKNIQLFFGIDRMVYNRLEMICTRILQSSNGEKNKRIANYEAWQFLLQIYEKREPSKIINLLEELESGLITNVSAKNTWHYLELVIRHTEEKIAEYKNAYYKILSICYKLGLFEEGMGCLNKMEQQLPLSENHLLILYKINYLTGLDRFDDAIAIYQWALAFIHVDSGIWFHLNLCILCSYRSQNQIQQCIQIGNQISEIEFRQDKEEYAYYLRLKNIYLLNGKALKYAYRSAKWFEKHDDLYQAGKSYITYSKLLASIGKYQKAIRYSKVAQELLGDHMEVSHFLLSNLAAYRLLNGEKDTEIWSLLCQAELSASVPYSRLAIIINKLVWCYENSDYNKLDLLVNSAKKLLEIEPDKHIHALYYYDMYLIYDSMNETSKSEFFYTKAFNLQNECRFIAARLSGTGKHHREIRCRLKKPWHVCFLSFWTYDLPTDENLIESS